MNGRVFFCAVSLAFVMSACAGCMPTMSVEVMEQMQPQRPVELEKLNMFEGRWEGTGEAKIAGLDEVLSMKGGWQADWECDGWYLVSREEFEMGESGKVKGLGLWTWDPKRNTYRTLWFGAAGAMVDATTTYDEPTRTWTLKFKGDSPAGATAGRGCVKMVGDDTMEWTWDEWPRWDFLRLFKSTEMKGTYKRR